MKLGARLAQVAIIVTALASGAACGKDGGGGGGADTLDTAALKVGDSKTATLKFWTLERGLHGDDLADNAHFDDAKNNRVVLYHDPAMKESLAKLKQGASAKVTFTVEEIGPLGDANKMITGTLTKLE